MSAFTPTPWPFGGPEGTAAAATAPSALLPQPTSMPPLAPLPAPPAIGSTFASGPSSFPATTLFPAPSPLPRPAFSPMNIGGMTMNAPPINNGVAAANPAAATPPKPPAKWTPWTIMGIVLLVIFLCLGSFMVYLFVSSRNATPPAAANAAPIPIPPGTIGAAGMNGPSQLAQPPVQQPPPAIPANNANRPAQPMVMPQMGPKSPMAHPAPVSDQLNVQNASVQGVLSTSSVVTNDLTGMGYPIVVNDLLHMTQGSIRTIRELPDLENQVSIPGPYVMTKSNCTPSEIPLTWLPNAKDFPKQEASFTFTNNTNAPKVQIKTRAGEVFNKQHTLFEIVTKGTITSDGNNGWWIEGV